MGLFKSDSVAAAFPAILFVLSAGTTDAGVDTGGGITAVQLAIGILVFLAYAVNHFRGTIRSLLRSLFAEGERRQGTGS
jgi:hypothetical protein